MSKVFTITEGLENMGAIKTGGQGSVYKGRRIGEIITAIKLLPTPIVLQDEENKHYRDFINEVKKLQRVAEEPNPNIVKILSSGISETGGFPYIEMEFIDGPDLSELLKPPHPPVFSIKEIIKVGDQLSHALSHCHKLDVKHGDIKSNNVKYNQHTGNYVLLDFGLAILSDEDRRTSLRHAGAVEFMAPEQNEGRMLFETDIYSFGIILYELLAGEVPFPLDGNSVTARNKVMVAHMEMAPPDALSLREKNLSRDWTEEQTARAMRVPEWIISLIDKCLQKKPEDRYANGMELYDFISHHRIHTAEVPGLVKGEDTKWKALVTKKEAELEATEMELEDLKAIVLKQDSDLQALKAGSSSSFAVAGYRRRGTVSKSAFTAVLIIAVLAGCLAIYSLFFTKSVVSSAQKDSTVYTGDSASVIEGQNGTKNSESNSSAKKLTNNERKKRVADSLTAIKKSKNSNPVKPLVTEEQDTSTKEDISTADANSKEAGSGNVESVRYKVRNIAYFHNQPDESTKRAAFINHWNNSILKPLNEKNGFIYVIYKNDVGQISKGWLLKSDLLQVR
jgi:serine/threonine-protein kinase